MVEAVGIGLSRVHLGYHWLTDVVGSWILAVAWVTLVATVRGVVVRRLQSGGDQVTRRTLTT